MTAEKLLCVLAVVCFLLFAATVFLCVIYFKNKKDFEKSKKATSLLLATTAHDLRSPLTAIKGFADALLEGKMQEDKAQEALAVISSESDRLARLSSRLCSNETKLQLSVFDVSEAIRRAFILTERKFLSKNISVILSFENKGEFYVKADSDAIFEVVHNLFENAVKYCPDGGNIVWDIEKNCDKTEITVKNTAISSLPDGIFRARVRGETNNEKGHGLGLYISQKLLSAHKSNLFARTEENESSVTAVFTFSLDSAKDIEI